MACSMGTVTNMMEDCSSDSEDCSNKSVINPEIKKLAPKKGPFSGFEPLANHEDHNEVDGGKSAEIKTGFINTPVCNNVSSFELEHQYLINENFSSLRTSNKVVSNTRNLYKLSEDLDLLQQKTPRVCKNSVLKKRVELYPKRLLEEKADNTQENGNKLCIDVAEGELESIKEGKHECDVTADTSQCSSGSPEPLLTLTRNNTFVNSKGHILQSKDEVDRHMTVLQYMKSYETMNELQSFTKKAVQLFSSHRSRKLRQSSMNINVKKAGGKRKHLGHYNLKGRIFCEHVNKTNSNKEENKVLERENITGNAHSNENTMDSVHEDEDYNTSALNKNKSFVLDKEDSNNVKNIYPDADAKDGDKSSELYTGFGKENNYKDNFTEDYMHRVRFFDNENLIDKSESNSSDKSQVTAIFVPEGENGGNGYFRDTALHNSSIIGLAPNEKKDFTRSKQADDSCEKQSSLRKDYVYDTGNTDNEDTASQNHTKDSTYNVHSLDEESQSEASSSNESDFTTNILCRQNRSTMCSNDSGNNTSIMLKPNESKSFFIKTKISGKAESTALNEDIPPFPEKSNVLETIISDVNTTNHYYIEYEYLGDSMTKVLSDKTEANLCKTAPDTKCPQGEYANVTEDCPAKQKSTEYHDSLQDQIAEINDQILNLSSSKECIQGNNVNRCPTQTINKTGLVVKSSKINQKIGYASEMKKNIGDDINCFTNSNDTVNKQTSNSEIPVGMENESNLNSNTTRLFDTSQDAPTDPETLMNEQSMQCLSTNVQIKPNSFCQRTVENITNTNTYNEVSQIQEATSGEAFYVYHFKMREEEAFIPVTAECVSHMTNNRKYKSMVVSDNADNHSAVINAEEAYQPYKYILNEKQKQENVLEEQTSSLLWNILSNLECPFNWLPDIQVLDIPDSRIQEDLIHKLTEKEKEFSRAKTNVFREIIVYLVLAYEKACEDRLIDALADLSHCYSLLGNPQLIPAGIQLDFKDINITTAKGDEYYKKLKERRAQAKARSHRHHALQTLFDSESYFCSSDKLLPDGQNNKKCEGRNASTLSQRDHLLHDCRLCSEKPKASALIKNNVEKTIRNEVENNLIYEGQLFVDDIGQQSPKNKQKRISSENKGSKETHNEGITLNSHVIHKPTVCTEDVESDITKKMCSLHLGSHPTLDEFAAVKSEGTEPVCDVLEKPLAIDETEKSCKATSIEEERKVALIYAVTAAVAHVAYICVNYQESYVAAQICKYWYSQLGKTGMATLLAVKGSVFLEYGIMGNKLGLPYLKEALSLDPDYWEWNLLCGKVIGRLHKLLKNNSAPEDEEVQLLEKAAQLNPSDASCLVHLANVYRSLAHFQHIGRQKAEAKTNEITQNAGQNIEHIQTKLLSSTITSYAMDYSKKQCSSQNNPIFSQIYKPLEQQEKDYLHLARQLYLKALKLEQHCPYSNARCARGLWSMPYPYKDKQLAQKAILHALTLAPSDSLVNHYAGMFYEVVGDKVNALECYKRATSDEHFNYPVEISYINLKLKMSPRGCTPVIRLDHLLYKYSSPHFMVQTLCFKGYCLYMLEKKILLAIRSITAAIIMDPTHSCIKAFRLGTYFGRNIPAVNFYELLKEMLQHYWQSPERMFNQEYCNGILEAARRLTNEYTANNQEKDSNAADAVQN